MQYENSEANISRGEGFAVAPRQTKLERCIKFGKLTVDSDSDALREDKSIFALEGGDFSEGVDLEVLSAHTLGRLLNDKLDIKTVCLSNS